MATTVDAVMAKAQAQTRVMSSQGHALAQRHTEDIGVLQPRHFTTTEAEMPSSAGGQRRAEVLHMPVSLAVAAQQKPTESERARVALDGFLLLESTGMGLPDDARQAMLADRSLGSVVEEDFAFFTGLIVVDVSENFLALAPFGALPRLKELRIACNNIQKIDELYGFEHLMYLDISYNTLTTRSVQSLDVLPNLKDLDLSGNNLRGLPFEMYRFRTLERLIIDNNKIDDNNIFSILCTVPNLRFLSAAYNFLWKVAPECCAEGYFKLLSTLDVSFNYFGTESDIQPIIELNRLTTVMLYGNPLLGPKGEDPLYIYIEALVETASDLRLGSNRREIDFITEIPRNRILKKGMPAGRKATYRDFSIVQVEPDFQGTQPKTANEWREVGNQTLFAEAIAIARKQQMTAHDNDTTTFITASHHNHEDEEMAKKIADSVMDRVAAEMGIRTSADILHMRDRISMGRTAASIEEEIEAKRRGNSGGKHPFMLGGGGYNSEQHNEELAALDDCSEDGRERGDKEEDLEEKVPHVLFNRTLGEPQTLTTHPIAVKTAMRALQFAIRHPLTNYTEVPAKGMLPPKDYVRPTMSSVNRKLPRKEFQPLNRGKMSEDLQAKKDIGKGLPEPLAIVQGRKAGRDATLVQIEEVLDNLNKHSDNLLNKKIVGTAAEQLEQMKGFARPTGGLRSLVQMVNEVVQDLN